MKKILVVLMTCFMVIICCSCQNQEERKAEALSMLDSYATSCSVEEIQSVIDEYYDIMTDDEKQMVLESLGVSMALEEVEKELISNLKSPSSYVRYSYEIMNLVTYHEDDDHYSAMVDIEYGAKNSFGVELKESVSAF